MEQALYQYVVTRPKFIDVTWKMTYKYNTRATAMMRLPRKLLLFVKRHRLPWFSNYSYMMEDVRPIAECVFEEEMTVWVENPVTWWFRFL